MPDAPTYAAIEAACDVLEWCAAAPSSDVPQRLQRCLAAVGRELLEEVAAAPDSPDRLVEVPHDEGLGAGAAADSTGTSVGDESDTEEAPPIVDCSYHEHLRHAKQLLETDPEEARAHLDRALLMVPDSARARRLLSMVHEAQGNHLAAHRTLAEAQSIDYAPDLHERLEALREAIASDPPADRDASGAEPTSVPATPIPTLPPTPTLPLDPGSLSGLLGSDAMQNLLRNPQIMAMAQSMASDPNMRQMVDQLQRP